MAHVPAVRHRQRDLLPLILGRLVRGQDLARVLADWQGVSARRPTLELDPVAWSAVHADSVMDLNISCNY